MTTSEPEEKRYSAFHIEWNRDYEEYEYTDEVTWKGETLQFNTYEEFLQFMSSLTEDEKLSLGLWRLCDEMTDEYVTINDGSFDEVSIISINAKKMESEENK